ncbi:MAG TPA: endolytic transglycosylase MltG [Marinilabiliaceae bacterium]|nr:endolytic transglycosylase MltG [Marinilabiliaceae bacterium]
MVSKKRSSTKRQGVSHKGILSVFAMSMVLLAIIWIAFKYYNKIWSSNVIATSGSIEIFIPTDPTYEEVFALLDFSGALVSMDDFDWVVHKKGLENKFEGGRYLLTNGMSNNEIINMLRSGKQSPVRITFTNVRTVEELAGQLGSRLEPDSIDFLHAFKSDSILATYNVSQSSLFGNMLPNTYEMWWTTTPEGFLKRMFREYDIFWNDERSAKADAIGLTSFEVLVLASIVDEETVKADEKARVAGVYINRLQKGIRLQADPTIKYVMNDFSVKRILSKDLLIDSPYNTYIYAGLPPGPIRMPSIQGVEAVLDFEKHNYLYMCAREDFSGYHSFARTLQQHNQNASRYRNALQKLKIYR